MIALLLLLLIVVFVMWFINNMDSSEFDPTLYSNQSPKSLIETLKDIFRKE